MTSATDHPSTLLHRLAKQVPSSPDADGIHLAARLLLAHERKHGVTFLPVPTEVLDALREAHKAFGSAAWDSRGNEAVALADAAEALLDLAPSEQESRR